ncbi:MAG: alanyl-tRNA editing protein [Candidatus Nanohaloarchaea archaeon]|nr:alanyl-tRNA editing protein [Candidatus Nanohaloarchaea archaeon]
MTEKLYMDDCYQKGFNADIIQIGNGYIVLDQTAFYPKGGGQPSDTGRLATDSAETQVNRVRREDGDIRHFVDTTDGFSKGDTVEGIIDWERRHRLMRMHTAQHILSAVVLDEFDAETAGNQIHEDYSRMDFEPIQFTDQQLQKLENRCNSIIEEELDVSIYYEDRDDLIEDLPPGRSNLDLIPDHVDPLRVVEIEDTDICPCGGTHVRNTGEIGQIEITGRQSKGEDIDRVTFTLHDT